VDAGVDSGIPYASPTGASSWSVADITSLSTASTYNGVTFDGRYVYFAPDGSTAVALRYDTHGTYGDPAAWSTYLLTTRNASAFGYRGAAFDGRYVYFVPSSSSAILSRFDTHGSFTDDAMWTMFDMNAVGAAHGLQGATFDGRYLYLVPSASKAIRYDTTSDIATPGSWSTQDLSAVDPHAVGYIGAVFDGRYVYYAPSSSGGVAQAVVARFDTLGAFSSTSAWSTFDVSTVSSAASGFRSAAFDGRYVYLVPGWTAPTPAWSKSTVARLDTQADFGTAASWTTFDTTTLDPDASGYNSATFDGRFLIFAPGYDATSGAYHGRALLYDTTASFGSASAWTRTDTTAWSTAQVNMRGAAFDGEYVYFAPRSGSALRFLRHASPAKAGFPALGGSFY